VTLIRRTIDRSTDDRAAHLHLQLRQAVQVLRQLLREAGDYLRPLEYSLAENRAPSGVGLRSSCGTMVSIARIPTAQGGRAFGSWSIRRHRRWGPEHAVPACASAQPAKAFS